MKPFITLFVAVVMTVPSSLSAQTRLMPRLTVTLGDGDTGDRQFEFDRWRRPVIRIGQDYTLRTGDEAGEVLVVFGNATIEGRVDRNVVVVLGDAKLSGTATIDGALVVVGGSATAAPGAVVDEDLFVFGGGFDAPIGFSPGGESVIIGSAAIGGRLGALVPWVTRGLLWGRPIVPDLSWVWGIVGVVFLVYLSVNLLFDRPVAASAARLAEKPLTAFAVGLLVLLLAAPVCLVLAASVIGIPVVPFVVCALFVAGVLGKAATARWIGLTVLRQGPSHSRMISLGAFLIGFAMIVVAYMVPVLGFLTWSLLSVFGLGAATMAFMAEYRRENPVAPPPMPPSVPLSPIPSASAYGAVAGSVQPLHEHPMHDTLASEVSPLSATRPPPNASDLATFPHAAFRDRLAAFVLDVVLVVIAVQVLDVRDEAIAILIFAYFIGFWTWKGTTLGGIVCQLRVVRMDGAPLRFADALVRGLSSIFSLAPLGMGCFWILRDPEQQAWHDKIAGTYVVRVPRNYPL